jgi:hypothetical protein
MHSSWERACDLEAVDPAARTKLKRYAVQMEAEHGPRWRALMEEEDEALGDERQYYEADLVEVQRVIGCTVAEAAHEKRLRAQRHAEYLAAGEGGGDGGGEGGGGGAAASAVAAAGDDDDDEEDEVKYLVKWRGQSYDLVSCERFGDIKHASDQVRRPRGRSRLRWAFDEWLFTEAALLPSCRLLVPERHAH